MLCKILRVSFLNKWISSKNLTFRFCSSHVEVPTLPSVSFEPKPYKGPNYNDVLNSRNTNISPFVRLMYKEPVMINQGYMQYVWDHTGKRYLDMFGGIVTVSVGHCHPKVTKAAVDQMHKLWHVTNLYMHPELHEYAKKLTDRLPGDLKVCYFCNSGSEANDLAIQLSRLYTGAFDVISLRNAYHGDTPYSIGLCGIGTWKHSFPNGFGMHQKTQRGFVQGVLELKEQLDLDFVPGLLVSSLDPTIVKDFQICSELTQAVPKKEQNISILRSLALETIDTMYLEPDWVHIYTNGRILKDSDSAGAGVYCHIFFFYLTTGKSTTAFDGEAAVLQVALAQLHCHLNSFCHVL
ncbi:alanine--glyoxylate aminotransferase 2 homolog 1, mitochondrial [Trichonephila clavipes]|nr:alanine--glyoxylate aminotransferase 2 homolog 1, mitochondrial [Trichonephila clavipes]